VSHVSSPEVQHHSARLVGPGASPQAIASDDQVKECSSSRLSRMIRRQSHPDFNNLLSCCTTEAPLNPLQTTREEHASAALSQPTLAAVCRAIETDGYAVVGGLISPASLRARKALARTPGS
jgi:hypothetical protein